MAITDLMNITTVAAAFIDPECMISYMFNFTSAYIAMSSIFFSKFPQDSSVFVFTSGNFRDDLHISTA